MVNQGRIVIDAKLGQGSGGRKTPQTMSPTELSGVKEKNPQFGVYTPYCFWVSPGVVLEDRDFLMEEINSNTITNKSCAYTIDKTKEFFKSFFPHYYINKGQMEITSVLCKNAERSMIKNVKNGDFFNFLIDNTISRKNYRISKSRIKKSSIFFY
jgi:hypothetical protein